ncbi:Glucanase [Mycena indigotica]|uniref:Glucanase n=1 Tax=Mycena indigotica TaxID=2126181 RepID=A0A8H6W4M7_9AGAR|nr:Glucanase [Mycena indigotica]KAF7299094.1 Glucanase [Mycena indigotica]
MFPATALLSLCFLAVAHGQQVATLQAENHPALPMQQCTAPGSCTTLNTAVVLDSNWRWTHSVNGSTNCYTGNTWDKTLCPDPTTCATNCALDGADYPGTYGISTSGSALTLKFKTGSNVGSRVYLTAPGGTAYQMFKLINQEFTFTVDMSHLGCGLNGALYFSEMDSDGGLARFPGNKAGAKYGTGYCDSQCPRDLKWIGGQANVVNWTGSASDANSGTGSTGTCCNEMDIWEANQYGSAYTPHPCSVTKQTACTGLDCGSGSDRYNGICDKDGCDFNSWRMGNQQFLGSGSGFTIDTTKPITVVTQFISSNGGSSGSLSEIRRVYVQNGKVIANSNSNIAGVTTSNSITDSFCTQQKTAFGDTNSFSARGGLNTMGGSLSRGMVLSLSVWDDHEASMLWLDSNYPLNKSATTPGVSRGPCDATSGDPKNVESQQSGAYVIFSDIKIGPIGSTYSGGSSSSASSGPSGTSSAAQPTGSPVGEWGQCGGQDWHGSTTCAAGLTCVYSNPYYSQCLRK